MPRVLSLRVIQGVLVAVFLLVLPRRRSRVLVLTKLVVALSQALRVVGTYVLPKRLFDHAIGRELFVWLHQHLSHGS